MNYTEISKITMDHLYQSYTSLANSPLDPLIRVLIELRVSQINGCAECCGMHSEEARKLNISQQKLDLLPGWAVSNAFTEKEKLALRWCEAVTGMKNDTQEIRNLLFNYYSEREIVDLTACISIMNTYNRMAICLKI
ncbi:MAG: carboxymuconolactone decarboxylase family protein [Chlamydiales bacterium]